MSVVICILSCCQKEVTGVRKQRGIPTCSAKCAYTHNLNNMTLYRAKEKGLETAHCINEKCGRIYTKTKGDKNRCTQCRGARIGGRKPGRNAKSYSAQFAGSGKKHCDFRSNICNREGRGGLCRHFSACSDTLFHSAKGEFKYQKNGGVDCWEESHKVQPNYYGSSRGQCG